MCEECDWFGYLEIAQDLLVDERRSKTQAYLQAAIDHLEKDCHITQKRIEVLEEIQREQSGIGSGQCPNDFG
jgi:hypothetical protein